MKEQSEEGAALVYDPACLREAHSSSSHHQALVLNSSLCACFFCLQTFAPAAIFSWVDTRHPEGATAVCPHCSIDAVLGSASGLPVGEPGFLRAMQQFWFGGSTNY